MPALLSALRPCRAKRGDDPGPVRVEPHESAARTCGDQRRQRLSNTRMRAGISRRARTRPLRLVASGAVLIGLGGCGSTAPAHTQVVGVDRHSAGAVAQAYARHLFAGEFPLAAQSVLPAEQSVFRAITLGVGSASTRAQNLAVGSVAVTGQHAVVVLTGTLCTTASRKPLSKSPSAKNCVSNRDPKSTNPIFRVQLVMIPAKTWYVYYPTPTVPTPSR